MIADFFVSIFLLEGCNYGFFVGWLAPLQASIPVAAESVLFALRESVRRRSSLHAIFQVQTSFWLYVGENH